MFFDYLMANPGPVVAAGAAIFAAGVAVYIRHRNSLDGALLAFRSSFAEDLTALRQISIGTDAKVFDLLRESYPRHETAYRAYDRVLGPIGRWRLQRRWIAYRGPYPTPPQLPEEDEIYRLGHFNSSSPDEERANRDGAIRAIEKLIV